MADVVPPEGAIDRGSPIPLYHQLEELLRLEIDRGHYPPGSPLPSESEICATYGVSRSVVRQSLTNLVHSGLIRTERGRGSFVAEHKVQERFVSRTTGLHDDLRRMGYSIGTRIIVQEVRPFPLPAREALGVDRGIQLDRVRSVDGRVLAYIRSCLREDRCPGLDKADLEDRSLYDHLAETYGLRLRQGGRTVEAMLATGDIARHLEVADGEALLLVRSSASDEDGEPLEWFEAWHRADRTAFAFEIGQAREGHFPGVVIEDHDVTGESRSSASGDDAVEAAPRRKEVRDAVEAARAVAVLRAPRFGAPVETVDVLVRRGFPVVEFALTGDNALDAISRTSEIDGAVVGAGSVFDAAGARDAVAAGAAFVVAPIGAYDVVHAARSVPVLLAGWTSSEVWDAWQHTEMPVKIFPASVGGPDYLHALHGPMPQVPLLASGGIDAAGAVAFLRAGAIAIDVDDALCPPTALEHGDVDEIEARAATLRRAIDATL